MRHICLGQPEESAALEHGVETGHNIEFSSTAMLVKALGYLGAIEVRLRPRNFSTDGGFSLYFVMVPGD
jgi:hypothetical protein